MQEKKSSIENDRSQSRFPLKLNIYLCTVKLNILIVKLPVTPRYHRRNQNYRFAWDAHN